MDYKSLHEDNEDLNEDLHKVLFENIFINEDLHEYEEIIKCSSSNDEIKSHIS